ncbi:MAG: NAD(P)H-dependent oxidoreductase subunit E [Bacteroidales bacterium]|jgi:NADH-quinone oxidoreductase subunit E|nr:NAD(P)H-dependent oxidoreductase subunit E [Bacteroidales bacterium]
MIESILEKYPFVQRDNIIPILQDIQKNYGFLSEESIIKVGKYLNMPTSKIYGLATFYNQFRFEAKAKYHIRICNGTSCHINSNLIIINEIKKRLGIENGGITKDGLFSLEETTCMGACGLGPVMAINERYYTEVNVNKIPEIIEYYLNNDK